LAATLKGPAAACDPPLKVLGPAPAQVFKLRKQYRFHMLLSAQQPEQIQDLWRTVRASIILPSDVELVIDVDPLDMR
jgi:primosomal protein N' (replication factor Y)